MKNLKKILGIAMDIVVFVAILGLLFGYLAVQAEMFGL